MPVPLSADRRDPVGRDAELLELSAWAQAAKAGRSSGLVVSGDAGIGKTTLLSAFARTIAADGTAVAVGHCVDLDDTPLPYLPFAEALDRIRRSEPARIAALIEKRPALERLLARRDTAQAPAPADAATARAGLFEAMHAGLEELADERGLLIWLEDVHWADRSSLDLLTYLFTRGFDAPVLLAASYRSDDLNRQHPLRPVVGRWARLPVHRLEVRPLEPEAVRALLARLDWAPVDPASVQEMINRADGNAFFAEELASAARRSPSRDALPDDLARLLLDRLDGLDTARRAVVRAMAVGGRTVRHELLADVVGLPPDELGPALREALDGQLLRTEGDGYRLRHALLAEAVSADLLPDERVRLHRAYLSALQRTAAPAAGEVARHARACGEDEVALVATVQAAREALALGGPDEALAQAEIALDLMARHGIDQPAAGAGRLDEHDVVLLASAAAVAAGRVDRAIALLRGRLDGADVDADPLRRARLLTELATVANMTDSADGFAPAAESLALVPATPSALRAETLLAYAAALVARGRRAESLNWAEQAAAMAGDLGLTSTATLAATWVVRLRAGLGDGQASLRELIAVADDARDRHDPAEIRPRSLAGMQAYELGDLDTAVIQARAAAARAEAFGRPWTPYALDGRVMAALALHALGRWDEALAAVDLAGPTPPSLARAMLLAGGMAVRAGRGETDVLETHREIRAWWPGDGMVAVLGATAAIDAAADTGGLAAARQIHRDVTEFLERTWFTRNPPVTVRLNALIIGHAAQRARLGQPSEVQTVLADAGELIEAGRRADRIAAERGIRGPESAAWAARLEAEAVRLHWLAGAHPLEGHTIEVWRASVEAFETFPHVFERARSQVRLASVLAASGDRVEARAVAGEARRTAAALHARPLLRELDRLGLRLGSGTSRSDTERRRGAPGSGSGPLTAREAEVLALVAEGLSNADIGRRLVISGKTVSVHVSNILSKLEASGRTEAVTVARRRGLLD